MRAGICVVALTLCACASKAPPLPPPERDPGVSFDFKVVPRAPDVAAYPAVAEHVLVPTPSDRTFIVVRVVNNVKPKPLPAPNFVRVAPQPAPKPMPAAIAPPPHWEASVGFAFDRSSLDAKARDSLDKLISSIGPLDGVSVVVIDAYADGKGTDPYNDKLTMRRADSVKAYLVSKGVRPESVTATPHGKRDPIAPNSTDEGRAANRRANVQVDGSK